MAPLPDAACKLGGKAEDTALRNWRAQFENYLGFGWYSLGWIQGCTIVIDKRNNLLAVIYFVSKNQLLNLMIFAVNGIWVVWLVIKSPSWTLACIRNPLKSIKEIKRKRMEKNVRKEENKKRGLGPVWMLKKVQDFFLFKNIFSPIHLKVFGYLNSQIKGNNLPIENR